MIIASPRYQNRHSGTFTLSLIKNSILIKSSEKRQFSVIHPKKSSTLFNLIGRLVAITFQCKFLAAFDHLIKLSDPTSQATSDSVFIQTADQQRISTQLRNIARTLK